MLDYEGDLSIYQKQLDEAGIDFDITNMAGARKSEIEGYVGALIAAKTRKMDISA